MGASTGHPERLGREGRSPAPAEAGRVRRGTPDGPGPVAIVGPVSTAGVSEPMDATPGDPTGTGDAAPAPGSPWWKGAVFYQIYPRSFADTDGDGVGDLAGIRAHLADLAWLGVDALWISPFYRSPMVDFGYDVSDYCDVDPTFGTLDDFDGLIEDAHALGLRVIIDWVPNHTSDRHPWFVDAASGHRKRPPQLVRVARCPTRRIATQQLGGGLRPVGAGVDPRRGPRTSGTSTSSRPPNPTSTGTSPDVVEAMHDVLRFWLDRGVDGFRADVIHCIGKDPDLPDDPPPVAGIPHSALNDVPVTHGRLREIRRIVDAYRR